MKPARPLARSLRFSLWLASLAATGLLPLGGAHLAAQTAYTWNGGTGNWSNGSLWSTGSLPNSGAADVYIDGGNTGTASVVTLGNNYTVGRLTVDAGDTLNIANDVDWYVNNGAFTGSGSVVNNGTINFNDAGSGTFLHFNGAGTISGMGTINLNGQNSRIFANNVGDSITVGAGQTVAGRGNLGNGTTNFTNNAVVTANQSGGTLVLEPGSGNGFTNAGAGVARAEGGGTLELRSGTFSGGSFTALASSQVQIDSGVTVSGATLASVGTGSVTLFSATLNNATVAGGSTVNISNNMEAVANGTLTNNGTLTIADAGSGTYLRLGSATTLAGTGTVNLTGPNARLFANNAGDRLTIGNGATVAGRGNLGNGTTNFTNNGVVTANQNGNTLVLQPGGSYGFTNAGSGAARAEGGGVLELASGTFSGGAFTALAGSQVQVDSGAVVSNATLASVDTGTVTMNSATLNNATLAGSVSINNNAEAVANGTLTNNGTLTVNDTGSGTYLRLGGAVTFSTFSVGYYNLSGPNARIFATNAGDRLTINENVFIQGTGNLGGGTTTFTNSGIITANVNGGTLTIQPGGGTADFTNNVRGQLNASNGGTLAFSDANSGTLTNNGFIQVEDGSTFTVPAGALTNLNGTTLTGGNYTVSSFNAATPSTLSLGGGQIVTNNAHVELDGAGAVFNEINALAAIGSSGTLILYSHDFTTAGALANAGSVQVYSSTLTVPGALNNTRSVQVSDGGTVAVQGNVTNSGLITSMATVSVQGTLTNSGQLSTGYNGSAGAIAVAGALTQTAAGSLSGIGSVTAPTFSLAGSLQPGDLAFLGQTLSRVGTLTLNGTVGLLGNTVLLFDLAGTADASDQIKVNGSFTLDGTLNVNALACFGVGRYDLIDYTGTLTNNTLDLGTLPSGYSYSIDTSIAGQVDLVVTDAVPEPSTWAALLAGSGFLVFTLRRRKHGC